MSSPTARARSSRPTRRGRRRPARSARPTCTTAASIDLRERQPGWDAPGFDAARLAAARGRALRPVAPSSRVSAPPVRAVAELPARSDRAARRRRSASTAARTSRGTCGSASAGQRGDRVTVRHAEVLEPDGSLHTRSLRSARATDTYILADDARDRSWSRAFTFHGFRYAEVETDAEILDADVRRHQQRHAADAAEFACSDAGLNRFHENVVWSQRDNFVSVPTDCPQRDERLGWTGDAQAFAPTGIHAVRRAGVLGELAAGPGARPGRRAGRAQRRAGRGARRASSRYGRAGWADAATIVPVGRARVVRRSRDPPRQCDSMRRWVDSL